MTRLHKIADMPYRQGYNNKPGGKKKGRARLTDQQADEIRALCSQALGAEVGVAALATIVGAVNRIVVESYKKGYVAGWKQGMIGGTDRVRRGDIKGWMWDTRHIRQRRRAIRNLLANGPKKEEEAK